MAVAIIIRVAYKNVKNLNKFVKMYVREPLSFYKKKFQNYFTVSKRQLQLKTN